MTKCTKPAEELQLRFDFGLGKPIIGAYTGGEISSDGGLPLVRLADERLRLTEHMALCLGEKRDSAYVRHQLRELLRQRVYAIACGYEDANDAGRLRADPVFRCAAGSDFVRQLASQPTISRLETSVTKQENGFLQGSLVHTYIRSHKKAPRKVIIDIDTTCDEVHGYQQLSFYNGFYGTDCYIPLFAFDQDGYPLLAVLRPGNYAPAEDVAKAVKPVIEALRAAWPTTQIELRADAAFCNRDIYRICEDSAVTYFIGLKSNHALRCATKGLVAKAKKDFEDVFGPANAPRGTLWRKREERLRFSSKQEGRMQEVFEREKRVRLVGEVQYSARSWDRERRVICRADYTEEGAELRFVVTNARRGRPRWIYEEKYCKRGQCENWIKEMKALKCDRLSCQEFESNQFRLLLHAHAYILLREMRSRLPSHQRALSVESLRNKFIKVGVLVRESARQVWLQWSSAYPEKQQFAFMYEQLLL